MLYIWEGDDTPPQAIRLSASDDSFCHVVPAGAWQAAEPIGTTVLVGCTVAPGFEFADFELMNAGSEHAQTLKAMDSRLGQFTTG